MRQLSAMHQDFGIVLRDIKADNILFDKDTREVSFVGTCALCCVVLHLQSVSFVYKISVLHWIFVVKLLLLLRTKCAALVASCRLTWPTEWSLARLTIV